ncbi:MAG TPA: SRPBCC family protein [Mucilaginibacter sp.]|nr:SRPBCC family protein [Mucilaginibacter sp.]
MQTINLTSIKKEFTVEASQQTAFEVFTQKMDLWWPRSHHIGTSDMTEVIAELCEGGRWYTKHTDGSEAAIGYVQTYQPYDLFVLTWQIDGDFKRNPDLSTEVVAEFISEGPKTTRVKFEHKDLHKLGNGKVVESMDKGWSEIMNLYKQFAEQ